MDELGENLLRPRMEMPDAPVAHPASRIAQVFVLLGVSCLLSPTVFAQSDNTITVHAPQPQAYELALDEVELHAECTVAPALR